MNAKRQMLAGAAAWLGARTAASAQTAGKHPWAETDIDMPIHQVGPHSYYAAGHLEEATAENQGFIANAGFVITGDGVVVFDTLGSPALADRLIGEIRRRTPQPIKLVVVSHYHADHFYGIPAFQAIGVKVWANALAKEYLSLPIAAQRLAERRQLIGKYLGVDLPLPLADRWLDNSVHMIHMGEVTLSLHHWGPAHTPEDEGMLVEPDGVMYSGDVVYNQRVPFVAHEDTKEWLGAIDRLLALDFRVMVPGHGPASNHPREDAHLTRSYLQFLREQMGNAVNNWESFDEAYDKVDWSRFKATPTFGASNRENAYQVFLEMEKESLKSQ